jgi:hypothetical protein
MTQARASRPQRADLPRQARRFGALLALGLAALALAALALPDPSRAQDAPHPRATEATYATPTDRYPHNIMGRLPAHTDLRVTVQTCAACAQPQTRITVRLPDDLVFEDFAPRLIDLDQDGRPEIVAVESHQTKGARLAIWEVKLQGAAPELRRVAATDFIGRRFRWLAPIGAADFDGDGRLDLAYVETPHLGKTLHIVTRDGAKLVEIAHVEGITNHAIGQETQHGRIEVCAGRPVIFALNARGDEVVAVQRQGGRMVLTRAGVAARPHHLDEGPLCPRLPGP